MFNFTCNKCGSGKLGYQKWIRSCSSVKIDDNNQMEFKQAVIYEDDELSGVDGFICMDCKHELHLKYNPIHTEDDLRTFLVMDPDKQIEQERLYQEAVEEEKRIEERMDMAEIQYLLSRADRYFNEES